MIAMIPLSQQKINELKQELAVLEESLKKQKGEQIKKGGTSDSWHETAAYGATREALESKVDSLKKILKKAVRMESGKSIDRIDIGTKVKLIIDDDTEIDIHLVHPVEADPLKGKISFKSPLGSQLLGKKASDIFRFQEKNYRIEKLS